MIFQQFNLVLRPARYKETDGALGYHSILIVKTDSPYQKLEDLMGRPPGGLFDGTRLRQDCLSLGPEESVRPQGARHDTGQTWGKGARPSARSREPFATALPAATFARVYGAVGTI